TTKQPSNMKRKRSQRASKPHPTSLTIRDNDGPGATMKDHDDSAAWGRAAQKRRWAMQRMPCRSGKDFGIAALLDDFLSLNAGRTRLVDEIAPQIAQQSFKVACPISVGVVAAELVIGHPRPQRCDRSEGIHEGQLAGAA